MVGWFQYKWQLYNFCILAGQLRPQLLFNWSGFTLKSCNSPSKLKYKKTLLPALPNLKFLI